MSMQNPPKDIEPPISSYALRSIAISVLNHSRSGYVLVPNPKTTRPHALSKAELAEKKANGTVPDVTFIPTGRWLAHRIARTLLDSGFPPEKMKPYAHYLTLTEAPLTQEDLEVFGKLLVGIPESVGDEIRIGLTMKGQISQEIFKIRYLQPDPIRSTSPAPEEPATAPGPRVSNRQPVRPVNPPLTGIRSLPRGGVAVSDENAIRFNNIWSHVEHMIKVMGWIREGTKDGQVIHDVRPLIGVFYESGNFKLNPRDVIELHDQTYASSNRSTKVMGLLNSISRVIKEYNQEYRDAALEQREKPVNFDAMQREIEDLYTDIQKENPNPYRRIDRGKTRKSEGRT